MPYLRCTQKLLKAIGERRAPHIEQMTPAILGDWYANLLVIARQKVLLFTNEPTLYSFAVLGVRTAALPSLARVFVEHLTLNLTHEHIPLFVIDRLLAEYRALGLAGTEHRSVVGSMNNLAALLEHYVRDAGGPASCSLPKVNEQLNRIPHKPLSWRFAVEALQERLCGAVSLPGRQSHRVFLN